MTDPTPATVAVPVELIQAVLHSVGDASSDVDEADDPVMQLAALLPKPKPRLVAVTREQWLYAMTDGEFDSQPDLLTLLDEAVRPVLDAGRVALVIDRIRAALGVTE